MQARQGQGKNKEELDAGKYENLHSMAFLNTANKEIWLEFTYSEKGCFAESLLEYGSRISERGTVFELRRSLYMWWTAVT